MTMSTDFKIGVFHQLFTTSTVTLSFVLFFSLRHYSLNLAPIFTNWLQNPVVALQPSGSSNCNAFFY